MANNRQGQNKENTPRKQAGLSMLFREGLHISKNIPFPYWHIDLNAGSGFNEKADCPGSPIVFLNEAIAYGRPFNALMCDNDPEAIEKLRSNTAFMIERTDRACLRLVCQDNAEALGEFSDWIRDETSAPHLATGSWLCDPNGFKREDVPLEELKEFCRRHPRIDAILNANISLFGRVRGCKDNPNTPGFDDWPDPVDVFGLEPLKSHWLVRNPPRGGNGENFILFLGRNTDAGMTEFEEFYPLHSERGQLIVKNLRRIRPEQPLWFED